MPTLAQSTTTRTGSKPQSPSLFTRLRAHLARIEAAHSTQARRAGISEETLRDTGLGPDALLGGAAHDPALPFFFQHRPGR